MSSSVFDGRAAPTPVAPSRRRASEKGRGVSTGNGVHAAPVVAGKVNNERGDRARSVKDKRDAERGTAHNGPSFPRDAHLCLGSAHYISVDPAFYDMPCYVIDELRLRVCLRYLTMDRLLIVTLHQHHE